jgi:hypothetical protein
MMQYAIYDVILACQSISRAERPGKEPKSEAEADANMQATHP